MMICENCENTAQFIGKEENKNPIDLCDDCLDEWMIRTKEEKTFVSIKVFRRG